MSDDLTPAAHDPGDSVPEGVAPAQPAPEPSEEDLKVKRKLEELPEKKD